MPIMPRSKVGKPTGKFSEAGKPLFQTKEGEIVSEKSITVPYGDKFANVPSIQKNVQYSEDEIMDMLAKGRIKPTSVHDSIDEAVAAAEGRSAGLIKPKMAKGGTVKAQTKKLLEQGGMLQEGGTVDPVSGNDVPVGSMQEEVRDDIPAKLSEGEFVFPADVVRYIGLERLMQMRQAAKEGLKKMEAMGQMSNSEEATEDDEGEFESKLDEILEEIEGEEEDEMEMAEGGMAVDQQQPVMPQGMTQEDVTQPMSIPQQQPEQPEQPDMMAQNMLAPSSIIQQDMAREGYSAEKKTEFEDLMVRIATNKAMAIQRNNTVFVLTPSNTEGTVRLHTFTADQPDVLQNSIGQLIDKLKEAKVQKVESQTRDQETINALESGGYKPNVSEEGGMYTYTMDIQEEPAVQ